MKIWLKQLIALILVLSTIAIASQSEKATGAVGCPNTTQECIKYALFKPGYSAIIYDLKEKVTQTKFTNIVLPAYEGLGKKYRHTYPETASGKEVINNITLIEWKDLPKALRGKTETCMQNEGSLVTNKDKTINVSYTCK